MPGAAVLVNMSCCTLPLLQPSPQPWPGLPLISCPLEQLPSSDWSSQPAQRKGDSFTKYSWVRSWTVTLLWFYTALTALMGKKWFLRTWGIAAASHLGVKFFSILPCFWFWVGNCHCRVNKPAERGSQDWGFLPSWPWYVPDQQGLLTWWVPGTETSLASEGQPIPSLVVSGFQGVL